MTGLSLAAVTPLVQAGWPVANPVDVALQLYELVGAAIGLFIAYLAYRGYRRNDSRPMLFIAIGFTLVLGLPLLVVPVYLVVPVAGGERLLQAIIQTFEIAGLLCIVYALRT